AWFTAGTGRVARKGVTSAAEWSGPIIRNFPRAADPCRRSDMFFWPIYGGRGNSDATRREPPRCRQKKAPREAGLFRCGPGVRRLLDVEERAQLLRAAGVAQLAQGLGLDLADALAGDV